MTEKKKRAKGPAVLAVILVLLLAAAGVGGYWVYTRYAFYRGELLPRDTQELDLRGQSVTAEDLEKAETLFDGVHILRDVTVGGVTYSSDETEIVTGDFSADQISLFSEFDGLRRVDATACSDVSVILALREALPEAEIFWTVPLEGRSLSGDETEITVKKASAAELNAAIARLPKLETVQAADAGLTTEEKLSLREAWPEIAFVWDVPLEGRTFHQGEEVVDLSGVPLDGAALGRIAESLPLLDAAAEIRLLGCGLSDTDLMTFADAHPELRVVWDTSLFGVDFTTEDTELSFEKIPLTPEDAEKIEAMTAYMPELTRVNMALCGIDNETMEAMNLRHDDIRFVWMVNVYGYGVYTDQTYYTVYNCPLIFHTNAVAEELRYCHDMVGIDLGHMHLFGDTSFFYGMPHLKYLIISNGAHSEIPELAACKELVWIEAHKTSLREIDFLLELPALRHLNLAYIKIPNEEYRQKDLDILKQLTWLERLWLGGNMFRPAQLEALQEALPNTYIKVVYGEDTLEGGWRKAEEYFKMRDAMHMYYMTDAGDTVVYNPYTGERSQYEWTNPFR